MRTHMDFFLIRRNNYTSFSVPYRKVIAKESKNLDRVYHIYRIYEFS